jgi:peroxiredoxin
MTIKIGDNLPEGSFKIWNGDGMEVVTQSDYFANKKVAVFGLPGAFTPTCSAAHLPGYVVKSDELAAKGIDAVACLSVNDAFVMSAWKNASNAESITMLADGDGSFCTALGLEQVIPSMGIRSQRFSMVVDNGQVTHLNIEAPGKFDVSDVDTLLGQL